MGSITIKGSTSGDVTLAAAAAAGSSTLTLPVATGTLLSSSGDQTITGALVMGSSFLRNRIINGDMRIDQRNAGASLTQTTANLYSLDRWLISGSVTSKFTVQRNAGSVTPPAGFTNYLGVTSSSAYSVTTNDFFYVMQGIEGFNVADLGWGASSAQTVTLSFWVRSSLTGNFGGALRNLIAGATRSYPFTYTINSANTWTQISVTIAGDTTGTWATDNSNSLTVCFGLGTGSTYSGTSGAWAGSNFIQPTSTASIVGTNGATFYITGVQLEQGTTATPFERRLYGQEVALCQRYCIVYGGDGISYERIATGQAYTTTQAIMVIFLPVEMRAIPSLTTSGNFGLSAANAAAQAITSFTNDNASKKIYQFIASVAANLVAGNGTQMFTNNTTAARFILSSEL